MNHKILCVDPVETAREVARELGLNTPGCYMIAFNGAVLYDCAADRVLLKRALPIEIVQELFDKAKRAGLYVQTYNSTDLITTKHTKELDYYVKSHFEQLVEQFVDCFSEYCNKIYEMQRQGRKGAIAYIHFSVLQTNILLKKHEIRLDAYDENWFLDYVECSDSYHVGEFYSYLEQYGDLVEELRKKSNGKTSLAEAQRRVFAESKLYLFYIAELIRAGMRKVVQTEAYQRIERAPCFVVCIGGYLDRFDILYKEDNTIKDSKEVRSYLQSKKKKLFSSFSRRMFVQLPATG